ncbi:sodium channel subunit beta-3 isoform X2 [Cervus canadensis]|uniref:sodium channel subunit beta-3 isoform X2 n=1 Tax=Cervus canadensis TaxID=1574408 RepID=UPI001C9E2B68|nr:sodium channel subunit beta-3 isoform X2 [Cervus canadensis]
MPAFNRLFPLASLLLILWVGVCFPVCVEVPSETEAVQGNPMKLRCISCMKREEVEATTVVEWFYRPEGGKDFLIYEYRNGHQEVESPFQGRLQWNGSKDLQDVSITVLNVTLNDSGLYTCNVSREFEFEAHRPFVKTTRLIPLRVTEEDRLGDDNAGVFTWSVDLHPQRKRTASVKPETAKSAPSSLSCVESLIPWAQRNLLRFPIGHLPSYL